MDLPIIVRYNKASSMTTLSTVDYEAADVRVDVRVRAAVRRARRVAAGFFPRWRRLIQRTVERACRELLATDELRRVFADAIQARVDAEIGENAKAVGVSPASGKLRVSYYTY